MIQTNETVIPLIVQLRVCKHLHEFVDVQEYISSNKMWKNTPGDCQSSIHATKAFSVHIHTHRIIKKHNRESTEKQGVR